MDYETGTRVIDHRVDRNESRHLRSESRSALHISRDRPLAARPQALDARERGEPGAQGLRLDDAFWQRRDRELARCFILLDADIADIADKTDVGVALLLISLRQQLTAEVERKSQRHWAYSAARHTNMIGLIKRELSILLQLSGAQT